MTTLIFQLCMILFANWHTTNLWLSKARKYTHARGCKWFGHWDQTANLLACRQPVFFTVSGTVLWMHFGAIYWYWCTNCKVLVRGMMAGWSDAWGKLDKVPLYIPLKENVESLKKGVNPAIRPTWDRNSLYLFSCAFIFRYSIDYVLVSFIFHFFLLGWFLQASASKWHQSHCFTQAAMKDYVEQYHSFLTKSKWEWKLASSTRKDRSPAWICPTKFEFWVVKDNDSIQQTYASGLRRISLVINRRSNLEIMEKWAT